MMLEARRAPESAFNVAAVMVKPVDDALEAMARSTTELASVLDELEQRLACVLVPEKAIDRCDPRPVDYSRLVNVIQGQTSCVMTAADRIRALLNRLEV